MTISETYSPFTATGGWQPATETQLEQMSDAEIAAYQDLHEAFGTCGEAEAELQETEQALYAAVREAREIEAKLAAMPKRYPDHTALAKEFIASQRRN